MGAPLPRCYRMRMTALVTQDRECDIHRLDLRYADLRLKAPGAVEMLARSLDRCGQLVPCLVVTSGDEGRLILVDGYRRITALKRLGRDTARVEPFPGDLTDALITWLTRAHAHPFAAIEEALLMRELHEGQGLSRHELAHRLGRDVSWVNRRLQLLKGLSEPLWEGVRTGTVSPWAAVRILAPLARANSAHAQRLLGTLTGHPLSTRTLKAWFERYREAPLRERERLVDHPQLFEAALAARAEEKDIASLRAGPEGECLRDARMLEAILARLARRLEALSGEPWPADLRRVLIRLCATLMDAARTLERYEDHDHSRDTQRNPHVAGPRGEPAPDRPSP